MGKGEKNMLENENIGAGMSGKDIGAELYEKWLGDVHLDCHSETGEVPQIAPRVDFEHAIYIMTR